MGFDRVKKREKESLRNSINPRCITVFTEQRQCILPKGFFGERQVRKSEAFTGKSPPQRRPKMSGMSSSETLKFSRSIDVYVVEKTLFRNIGSAEIRLHDDVSETVISPS